MHQPNLIETIQNLRTNNKEYFLKYLDELESAFNRLEPYIQAFIPEENRFDRLRTETTTLFQQHPEPQSRPPLFGLLIGVKDIFHVAGFPTKAGSNLPPETFNGQEAQVITKMRSAGALILGKTVTTEFAYFAPGPTRNPNNLDHTPGGSSSGSAAAVAAGLTAFATGTQTIGSISRPASYCGVVGYKPTYGRISAQGIIPLSPSVDHIGFFTQDIPGARFIAKLLVNDWDPVLAEQSLPTLGIPVGPYLAHASREMQEHFEHTCDQLALAGYALIPVQVMADFEEIKERHNVIVAAEASVVHKAWFREYASLYHPKTAELILCGQTIPPEELKAALAGREELRREISLSMADHKIDLWLSPAAPGPAPKGLESTGNPVMNLPWTFSGLPTLSLNSGKNHQDLPLGLQITGSWNQDEALFDWATQIETYLTGRIA